MLGHPVYGLSQMIGDRQIDLALDLDLVAAWLKAFVNEPEGLHLERWAQGEGPRLGLALSTRERVRTGLAGAAGSEGRSAERIWPKARDRSLGTEDETLTLPGLIFSWGMESAGWLPPNCVPLSFRTLRPSVRGVVSKLANESSLYKRCSTIGLVRSSGSHPPLPCARLIPRGGVRRHR